jgi:hypothetical protein
VGLPGHTTRENVLPARLLTNTLPPKWAAALLPERPAYKALYPCTAQSSAHLHKQFGDGTFKTRESGNHVCTAHGQAESCSARDLAKHQHKPSHHTHTHTWTIANGLHVSPVQGHIATSSGGEPHTPSPRSNVVHQSNAVEGHVAVPQRFECQPHASSTITAPPRRAAMAYAVAPRNADAVEEHAGRCAEVQLRSKQGPGIPWGQTMTMLARQQCTQSPLPPRVRRRHIGR